MAQEQNNYNYKIAVLQPDLPSGEELVHWISKIDKRHIYSNFGPLLMLYEKELVARNFIQCISPKIKASAISVSSGTTAIQAAIAALNLPKEAKILMPAYTFAGTALAAVAENAKVIFSDVDSKTWCLTPQIARSIIQHHKIDLILPVALFGINQDVEEWDAFTRETGIPVIIDAASALGHQQVGETTAVIYSLHATKPLGVGEGGLVASADQLFLRRVKEYSYFGFKDGLVTSFGINAKVPEYAAAIGLAQLDRWERVQNKRVKIYREYMKELALLSGSVRFPRLEPEKANMFMPLYFTSAELREFVENFLKEAGIETRRWYVPALHKHPYFSRSMRISSSGVGMSLPVTEALTEQILCLPFHTFLTKAEISFITNQLEEAIQEFESSNSINKLSGI